MKHRYLFLAVLALATALLFGASPGLAATAKKEKKKKDELIIAVVPGALRYATTRFDVTAGGKFTLTLKNTCFMAHNLVMGQPGKADAIFQAAMALGDRGLVQNFVPESPDIVFSFPIVNPTQSVSLELTAPTAPGEYPYLCTYPGHGAVMRGVMRVVPEGGKLEEPLTEKMEGPKIIDALKLSEANPKPMGTREHPFVLRSFAPNPALGDVVLSHHHKGLPAKMYSPTTGEDDPNKIIETIPGIPAGIAVSFGPDFAYVWDATECRLMYAWTGGFLEMTPYWGPQTGGSRRSREYVPLLEGQLVYKAVGPAAFQLGDAAVRPTFHGYQLMGGTPEFSYELGGTKIHEAIMPADPGSFMVHYRVENATGPVQMKFDPAVKGQISCAEGTWKENVLEIPKERTAMFMLLVKYEPGQVFKVDPAMLQKNKAGAGEP